MGMIKDDMQLEGCISEHNFGYIALDVISGIRIQNQEVI